MSTYDYIDELCENDGNLAESELVEHLKSTLIDPDVLAERNEVGWTLLHTAAVFGRSPEFCQLLIDFDHTLVKTQDSNGWLPLHYACLNHHVDIAKYFLEIYPESVNMATADVGWHPFHFLVNDIHEINEGKINEAVELFEFLMKHDGCAVCVKFHCGNLPLHFACKCGYLVFVKPFFDVYPAAIFLPNKSGETPLDLAISYNRTDVVQYLETQLQFQNQALNDQELDNNGRIPIHRALLNRVASVGAIKLMITAHPVSVTVADDQGCIPLHLACRYRLLDMVKCLVDQDENSLNALDNGGNLPLHYACLGGKLDIVNYILDQSAVGVTCQNTEGKLPIELLLYDAECDRSSMEFTDTVESLLKTNPAIVLANLCPGLLLT